MKTTYLLKVWTPGMNHAISPICIPTIDLITTVELWHAVSLTTRLKPIDQLRTDDVKVTGSSRPHKSNLIPGERKAMKELREGENITILPSDKGRYTVVLNTTDYKQEAKDLLSDTDTYVPLKKDPTGKYKEQLRGILKRLCDEDRMTEAQYYLFMPSSDTFPRQWRSQGLPGWTTRPPEEPKWGRKLDKFEEKYEKIIKIWGKNEESGTLAHPGLWGWLRPCPQVLWLAKGT